MQMNLVARVYVQCTLRIYIFHTHTHMPNMQAEGREEGAEGEGGPNAKHPSIHIINIK